jgi:Amt family ammonium transporter
VLAAQAIGSAIVTGATFVVALVLMYSVKLLGVLRVSEEGELEGIDLHEHGIPAYPEYALVSPANPQGGPDFTARAFPERAHARSVTATAS